jgi:glycosyltransferase involved in cell wall biosynthesis
LLEALRQLVDSGTNARLVIIGGRDGGPTQPAYVAQLDQHIAALNLGQHVTWLGFMEQADVSRWLQAVDMVALPFLDGASYRRGSLIAAIMHACAIVTTQPNVPVSTLRDHDNLSLVPVRDANALFVALRELATQPILRDQYRQNIATLRETFQWEAIAKEFVRVFEGVLRV